MTRQAAQGAPTAGPTVEFHVHFRKGVKGRRRLKTGPRPKPRLVQQGRIPRISRLMALAIHFDGLIRKGIVRDYAELARLGGVSRARMSQIMDLLNLAPEIQEEILIQADSDVTCLTERRLRRISSVMSWAVQVTRCVSMRSTHATRR